MIARLQVLCKNVTWSREIMRTNTVCGEYLNSIYATG